MNIKPEFRTSKEWKKFKKAIGHPAAMEFFVNIGCELEGITRASKQDNGFIDTKDPEDFAYLCGADDYDIEGEKIIEALLTSKLMIEEDNRYRLISWENQNTRLFSSRQNGRQSGRRKEREPNLKGKDNETLIVTEENVTERNVTGGLPQAKPTPNPGFTKLTDEDLSEVPF